MPYFIWMSKVIHNGWKIKCLKRAKTASSSSIHSFPPIASKSFLTLTKYAHINGTDGFMVRLVSACALITFPHYLPLRCTVR